MKTLQFQGYSDDTFGEYGVTNDDYDCCANGKPIVWMLDDTASDDGMLVVGQYSGRDWLDDQPGCWLIGIQQLDEDVPLPAWPMRWSTAENGYSPSLEIDVPDSVAVKCLNRTEDEE